ncbi:MAG: J domain-containing protein [Verrucomicrobiaceae bacterium]|nr:J domain-containing protein [Verrucomicrobiaceae bacterium]
MMDAFERLGLERGAVLDEEVLKAAWIEQGRAVHPDQAGGDAMLSAEVNAAYEVLREPETRLKHLLEVEFPEASAMWATVPMEEALMQVFMKLGPVLQRVEAFAKKKAAATSALAEALLMGEQMRVQEELEERMEALGALRDGLEAGLVEVDVLRGEGDAGKAMEAMRVLRAKFAYVGKWQRQGREALMKLI